MADLAFLHPLLNALSGYTGVVRSELFAGTTEASGSSFSNADGGYWTSSHPVL